MIKRWLKFWIIMSIILYPILFFAFGGGRALGLLFLKRGYYAMDHETRADPPAKTLLYYRISAGLGNLTAKSNLALFYAYGRGVPENQPKAVRLFEDILRKDPMSSTACFNLGMMYHHGWGVEQNPLNAYLLFQRSARNGMPYAQYFLGRYYEEGLNGHQDHEEAYAWYLFSHANGSVTAITRLRKLKEELDAEKIQWAELRSRELADKFPKVSRFTPY